MSWFDLLKEQLPTRWGGSDSAGAVHESTHHLLNRQQTPFWSASEVEALVEAKREGLLCYAHSKTLPNIMQSVVLGLDLDGGEILLDEFFPSPAVGLIDQNLSLSIPARQGYLHLDVQIVARSPRTALPSLLAKVQSKRFSQSRNSTPGVNFPINRGPLIELLLPMVPLMRGHILQLSLNGLVACVPQVQKPVLHTHAGQCTLRLDHQLEIKSQINIKRFCFNRKPFRHSSVGLEFTRMEPEELDQLTSFIHHFPATECGNHQAA